MEASCPVSVENIDSFYQGKMDALDLDFLLTISSPHC